MFCADVDPIRTLGDAEALLDRALGDGFVFSGREEADAHVECLERLRRKTVALAVECQCELQRSGVFAEDGHANAKVMVRHLGRLSNSEAAAREKASRMWSALPDLAAALTAGELGVAQLDLLGRVYSNRRVRPAMVDAQRWLLDCAKQMPYAEFEVAVREWERLADLDGAAQRNQRSHENRNVSMLQNRMDLSWEMNGSFGSSQGASIDDIYSHYIAAERLADWDKARAEHGDTATTADLARSESQRRADALWQIFQDAAGADRSAVPPDFCHHIIWSAETYETMLKILDPQEPASLTDVQIDQRAYRCETIDGVRLDPLETAATSLVAKMRRVVVDAAATVIDLGRARTFTGSARTAAQLSTNRCIWPGCGVPTSQCQIDHTHDHAKGGQTNPHNAAPLCGRHNRHKQNHFTTHRDPTGQWHTHRPDQTEIPP